MYSQNGVKQFKFNLHYTANSGQKTWYVNNKCKSNNIYMNNIEDEINEKKKIIISSESQSR